MSVYDRFPSAIVRPRSMTAPFLKPMGQTGPRTYDGRSQESAPDAGYWVMEVSVDLLLDYQIMEYRGFVTARQGRLNPFVIGIFDDRHAPRLTSSSPAAPIPHRDETLLSDATGYRQSPVQVALNAALAEGATTAKLKIINAGTIRRGMFFSIENRLYMIVRPPEYTAADEVSVTFLPPARVAASAGAEPDFGSPTVLMKLSDPMSGKLQVRPPYLAESTLAMEESFDGL